MNGIHEQLRAAGLRVTSPRVAVMEVLGEAQHVSADTVAKAARSRTGAVSTQAIYNVLSDLVSVGLVHRIEPSGSPALYELSTGGTHHHLMCRECAKVVDLACEHGTDACIMPPKKHGFSDIEADIVFWGTCRECRTRPNRSTNR
jgi:Fur family ferric uptake transcriptional regulator